MTAQRVVVACPHCATKLAVAASNQGQTLRCGKCQKAFRLAAPRPPAPQTQQPTARKKRLIAVGGTLVVILTILVYSFWPAAETKNKPKSQIVQTESKMAKVKKSTAPKKKPWIKAEMVEAAFCSNVLQAGDKRFRALYDFSRYPDRKLFIPSNMIKPVGSEAEVVLDHRGDAGIMASPALSGSFTIELEFTLIAKEGLFELELAKPLESIYGKSREFVYRSSGRRAGAFLAVAKFMGGGRLELARTVAKKPNYIRQGIKQQVRIEISEDELPTIIIDGAPVRFPQLPEKFNKVDPKKFSRVHLRMRAINAQSLLFHKVMIEGRPSERRKKGGNPRWEPMSQRSSSLYSSSATHKQRNSRMATRSSSRAGRRSPRRVAIRDSNSK